MKGVVFILEEKSCYTLRSGNEESSQDQGMGLTANHEGRKDWHVTARRGMELIAAGVVEW